MGEPVLSIADLRISFGSDAAWTRVVHGVSLDVKAGETVALVGESGSGKSVTALSVMQLLPSRTTRIEGSILLNGLPLLGLNDKQMQSVRGDKAAMIFQEPMTSLNPTMRVGRQIAEALTAHRAMGRADAEREAVRLLDRVRIPAASARYHDYPHLMSGGMRQRVMIAMALACRPKLLIADEPTTALDVTVQAQILDLLRDLQAESGLAILFITHDMGVVAEIADRVVVMLRGDVIEQGETASVFSAPAFPYTRSLLAAASRANAPMRPAIELDRPELRTIDRDQRSIAAKAPVLEVHNLSKRFDIRKGILNRVSGRVHAVDNVSFSLNAGETLALVGESGCGKSTTGRCIAGLTQPSSGTVRLNGRDISAYGARDVHNRLQMVFQDPYSSLDPRMRVDEIIAEPLVIAGKQRDFVRKRVEELLDAVGLSRDMKRRFPHEFSGGQRQRICIARALALDPMLVIADEAVSALDVTIKAQIVELLQDLQRRLDLSLLFISHDIAVVERISHRVGVMYLGEIVEIGDCASIFGDPQHPYTKRLLAAVPSIDLARRNMVRRPASSDLKSPIRSVDYQPPEPVYRRVGVDHIVQVWGDEWDFGDTR